MITGAGSPEVQNITLPLANTEYVLTFSSGTKKILLQTRDGSDLKIAFKVGESSSNYFTLKGFNTYYEDLITGPFILALQGSSNNTVIEIISWHRFD